MEALAIWGHQVEGVDSSLEMARLAFERRGVRIVVADGAKLPFSSGAFDTVVIASGVLDGMQSPAQSRILQAAQSVLVQNGNLVLSVMQPLNRQIETARALVTPLTDNKEHHSRIVDIWRAGKSREKWAELCRPWTFAEMRNARAIVTRSFVISAKWPQWWSVWRRVLACWRIVSQFHIQ